MIISKWWHILSFIFIVFILFYFSQQGKLGLCGKNESNSKRSFNFIITDLVIDSRFSAYELAKSQHPQVYYDWQDNDYRFYKKESLYIKLRIGDRLILREDELFLMVVRKDTSFMFDLELPCD